MGQACCVSDIQVEHKANMLQQQSNFNKNDPAYIHIPQDLPFVNMPLLNEKVQAAIDRMEPYQSELSIYERGFPSKARRINALGVVYEGEWKNMTPHGKGRMHFPDGSYYEGFFNNGVPDG
jgi:hypothetical protein